MLPHASLSSCGSARSAPRSFLAAMLPYASLSSVSAGADGEFLESTQDVARLPLRLPLQSQLGHPLQQGSEGDLEFQLRQRRTEAEVDARAEGDMRVLGASQVQPIRVGKDCRVAVGRAEEQCELGPLRELHAAVREVLEHPPLEHLRGGVVTE